MWWFLNRDRTETAMSKEVQNSPTCNYGKPVVLRQGIHDVFYQCSSSPQCQMVKKLNEIIEAEKVTDEKIPVS
jgi:ssDNA-binding Zn-finger/Zn-ribbon topoisomerase 1